MKIVGLGAGKTDPATRFRILNHLHLFQEKGHEAYFQSFNIPKFGVPENGINDWLKYTKIPLNYYWDIFRVIEKAPVLLSYLKSDWIFLNRLLIPCHISYERFLYKKLIFDFDDAIWLGEGKDKLPTILSHSKIVFAGNSYLLDYAKQYNAEASFLIPTAVDTAVYKPIEKRSTKFIIGWIGTSSNFEFLKLIYPSIVAFLKYCPDAEFRMMSNARPDFLSNNVSSVSFFNWSEKEEVPFIQSLSVGLMPLIDDEWCKGKCSYKMLQYLSCGIPVVVSPFGMNAELLSKAKVGLGVEKYDWYDALKMMYVSSQEQWHDMSKSGRSLVENEFDLKKINDTILRNIKKME